MKKFLSSMFYCLISCLPLFLYGHNASMDSCIPECACESDCGTFSFGADWLYWKVEQQKMQVGAEVTLTPGINDNFSIHSKVLKPKFKTDSGYRIFADYVTPNNCWRVEAAYTHVPSKAGFNHVGNPATSTFNFISLFGTNFPLLNAISSESFNSLNSQWDVDVNYFDLDLSRTFTFCDCCLEIRPHLGIRGEWIDQKFIIGGTNTLSFTSTMKGRLSGIGLEGGLWGGWNMGCGFQLIGHVGGSIVYAKSHNRGRLVGTMNGATTTVDYSDNSHLSLPSADSFIGIAYSNCLFNHVVQLHVGWEHHLILNTNQFSISGDEEMTLQGLTLGGSIAF